MATSARRPSSEENYHLLETQPPAERAQAPRQNGASGTDRPVVWGSLTVLGGAAAGSAAWIAVKSFANGDKVGGGLLTGVAVFCVCAGCYALSRLVGSLSNRDIQPIADHVVEAAEPNHNAEAARVHLLVLREIHSRLIKIVPPDMEIDLEVGPEDDNLHQSIQGRLLELEKLLPSLKEQIGVLKHDLKSFVQSRSGISMGAGLDSPPAASNTSFQKELLDGFDDVEARAIKAQASTNSSGFSSFTSSPAGNLSSFAAATPTSSEKTISPTARELFPAEDSEATPPPKEEER